MNLPRQAYYNPAENKGYSGVAVYSKINPIFIGKKLGYNKFDSEGRILEVEFKNFTLLNLYIPHGGRAKERLFYKLKVYKILIKKIKKIYHKKIILAGDFNIAHREIDLARPKDNLNNTMFSPIEREQIDRLIDAGFIDSFRFLNKEGGNYTWWPYMNNAREKNLGWRIDYIFISRGLEIKMKNAFILKNITGSDHCPIGITI